MLTPFFVEPILTISLASGNFSVDNQPRLHIILLALQAIPLLMSYYRYLYYKNQKRKRKNFTTFQKPIQVTVYNYDLSNVLSQLNRLKVTLNAIVKQKNETDNKDKIEAMKNELVKLKEIFSAYKKTELRLEDLNNINVKD